MSVLWFSQLFVPDEVAQSYYGVLKDEVQQRLIPLLEREGFEQRALPEWIERGPREEAYNPHGLFRRVGKEKDELIEIIYDERRYPQFHVWFGIAPRVGVNVWGKLLRIDEIAVAECPVNFSLSSSKKSLRPFAVVWPFMSERNVPKLVKRAEHLLPQVFAWFESGLIGENLRGGPNDAVSLPEGGAQA